MKANINASMEVKKKARLVIPTKLQMSSIPQPPQPQKVNNFNNPVFNFERGHSDMGANSSSR